MRRIATRTLLFDMFLDENRQLHAYGRLQDDRFISFIDFDGGRISPGLFHDLAVDMVVDIHNLEIFDIAVSFDKAPEEACKEIAPVYQQLKGVRIASGFTRKVLELAGGPGGCAHVTHLIIAMGPAIVQGAFTALAEASSSGPGEPQISDVLMKEYFLNSCHVWKERPPARLEASAKNQTSDQHSDNANA